jgi:hypothetical protein
LHLNELCLGNFRFRVGFEVSVRVLLCGGHLLKPLLITLEHLDLIRDDDLPTDHNRKPQRGKVLQHARKCRVWELLETHNRIEIAVDVEVVLGLIEDARLGRLLPGAAILKQVLAGNIRSAIAACRVLGVLQLLEEVLSGDSIRPEIGRFHGPLDTAQD